MKFFFITLFLVSSLASAQELKQFLKSCGYGTLTGAGLGLASLVFEKKPNESYGNIARGASLGLYGGIVYGLFAMNQPSSPTSSDIVQKDENTIFVYPTVDGKIETVFLIRF